jgi:hypothetical protein
MGGTLGGGSRADARVVMATNMADPDNARPVTMTPRGRTHGVLATYRRRGDLEHLLCTSTPPTGSRRSGGASGELVAGPAAGWSSVRLNIGAMRDGWSGRLGKTIDPSSLAVHGGGLGNEVE